MISDDIQIACRKALRRPLLAVAASLLLLAAVTIAIGLKQLGTSASTADLHRAELVGHAAAIGQCERVNTLRYEVDLGRLTRWRADNQQVAQIRQQIKQTPEVLKIFHLPPNSSAVKALTAIDKQQQEAIVASLLDAKRGETFLPFTYCPEAVDHPTAFRPPAPVEISQENLRRVVHVMSRERPVLRLPASADPPAVR